MDWGAGDIWASESGGQLVVGRLARRADLKRSVIRRM